MTAGEAEEEEEEKGQEVEEEEDEGRRKKKTLQLASPPVDCCFVHFPDACKLQWSIDDNAAHGGGERAVGSMVIMEGLMGSALMEAGRQRLRVMSSACCHVIIIIVVVGVMFPCYYYYCSCWRTCYAV